MRETLKIIEAEHRSIESVLRGLCFYVDQTLAGKPVPEAQVFRAMLQYLDLFAERLHHPKEDQFLFARLRDRTHDADAVLGRLEQDRSPFAPYTSEDRTLAFVRPGLRANSSMLELRDWLAAN